MNALQEAVVQRFLKYIKIPTPSSEASGTIPTTECQFDLARVLVEEMKDMGISDAHMNENCYVYGSIPATPGMEDVTPIGFIAHMDTVSDFTEHTVQPIVHENYDGEDLALGDSGRYLTLEKFPHLKDLRGRTLITSDGTTILGGDDKAGLAEILTMAEIFLKEESHPHGKICIGFTPDEEVGAGADYFDVEHFGAVYAFTVDGGREGGIDYENFNAASAQVEFSGVNVHPGDAKDLMVNGALVAMEFNQMLPAEEIPARTEGYQGFYHLLEMSGTVEKAKLSYIIRDHDAEMFKKRQETMQKIADDLNDKYGAGTVCLEIKEQYRNMLEMIRPHMHLIDKAKAAAAAAGLEPVISPIRGGTDGARLSFMGLPCPNLGTGGFACHGPYEHVTAEGMESMVKMLVGIVEQFSAEHGMESGYI